jgi:hypothetical protein
MRNRAMGALFVMSGVFFVAGVLDPPILPTWGGSATAVMATASARARRGNARCHAGTGVPVPDAHRLSDLAR